MKPTDQHSTPLRKKAEAQFAHNPLPDPRPAEDILHELRVYQIELEMQNEHLRELQVELEKSRDHYVGFYDFAPVGYLTLNELGMIEEINLTGALLLNVARSKLKQSRFAPFVSLGDRDRWHQHFRKVLTREESLPCELLLQHEDGPLCYVRLDCLRIMQDDMKPAVRIVMTDIDALQNKNTELEKAKAVADKANLAKSDFLSSMSHELRTPLNAILGFAQLLESGSPPPTAAQVVRLQQITKAGWYLLELINEILDLAVIESGKLSLSREPVSLSEVMHECQAMIETQAQQRDIQIHFHPCPVDWFAYADRTRVKQVVINLLSNAIKYNREHGTVEVECSASDSGQLHISIQDSGEGLPAEKLAQLFQPFNRLGQENGSEEGTGIGLVVTKRLVELMGGAIGVESVVGVGSKFWIELIRDDTPQRAAGHTLGAKLAPPAQTDAALRTLLYVEDNPANLMLVEQIIETTPHVRMLSARDGYQGIALAHTQLPDVIVMDINLPGISGIEALQALRKDPVTAHIPIIALSANAMLRDIEKGLESGFFRYLTKPIKIDEFMSALDEALKLADNRLKSH